jgi:GNAT superfamily N-acetyltransferase
MALLIRPALPEHAAELQGLVRAVRGGAVPRLSPEYVQAHTVCEAREGTRLDGFYAIESGPAGWRLAHLWVAAAHAGRGRGRWMLTDAVRRARRLGADVLRFTAEPEAERFFERMGAQRVDSGAPGEMLIELETWLEPLPESVSGLDFPE